MRSRSTTPTSPRSDSGRFNCISNYAFIGRKEPDFPGGLSARSCVAKAPENGPMAITDWWEMGFYTPFAVDQELHAPIPTPLRSDSSSLLPMRPSDRSSTASILSSATPCRNSPTRNGTWRSGRSSVERKGDYEFILNPIVDIGFGQMGEAVFAPAARFARNLGENLALGIEYYTDLGPLQNWSPAQRAATQHLCCGRFQDRALRRECRRWIWSDAGLRSADVQDDHRNGSKRGRV